MIHKFDRFIHLQPLSQVILYLIWYH